MPTNWSSRSQSPCNYQALSRLPTVAFSHQQLNCPSGSQLPSNLAVSHCWCLQVLVLPTKHLTYCNSMLFEESSVASLASARSDLIRLSSYSGSRGRFGLCSQLGSVNARPEIQLVSSRFMIACKLWVHLYSAQLETSPYMDCCS